MSPATKKRTRRTKAPSSTSRAVCLVSLGCSKALVDSEVMAGHLGRAGLSLTREPEQGSVVIVNTCGFIDDAREESIDTVLQYVDMKKKGELAGVVVTGCLVQLHQKQLEADIPEVDAWLPISDYSGVPSIVNAVLGHSPSDICAGGETKSGDTDLGRALLTTPHTAYLRLGEGCNHICAFCAIPKIRGRLKSKPIEVLVEEAASLAALGCRELTLIAEDSTDYGKDLKLGYGLADLLAALGEVKGIRWVRVMYAHPATMDERLIETMAAVPNVLPYIDMPVQHGDETVLKRMRRGTSPARIRRVVGLLREAIPGITLRTTILVGFPGETAARFGHLMDLLEELAFDRVGCFTFSPESNTEAGSMRPRVSRAVAEERRAMVMDSQRRLLLAKNKARIGTKDLVLVDGVDRAAAGTGRLAIGRTASDAPEVDGRVLVELPAKGFKRKVGPGTFLNVRITGAKGYDLVASPA
jgi:ribosomal protein S12 methylthiotransferase